MFNSITQILIT